MLGLTKAISLKEITMANPPVSRRAFLRHMPVAAAAAGTMVSSAALAAPTVLASAATAEIDALITKHRDALLVDEGRWEKVSDIEDAHLIGKRPLCRVQVSRLLGLGRNDDGSENWTPIYAYSVEEIVKRRDGDIDTLVSVHGWGKGGEARAQAIREKRTAWAEAKIEELSALRAEAKRIEDECGFTEALAAARASSKARRAAETAIISLVPDNLSVAAKKARWLVDYYRAENLANEPDDDLLLAALDAIAAAGAANNEQVAK